MVKTSVFCTVLFEATHNWPGCNIQEVEYLKYPHRHVFYIQAFAHVTHGDRDIEFIKLKHDITKYLETTYPDRALGARSCEMLAAELAQEFNLHKVVVSEDNENGCVLEIV